MEQGGDRETINKEAEKRYRVELRPPIFGYIANHLSHIYETKLESARREGSYQGLMEFYDSPLARIMTSILNQFPDKDKLPEKPFLNISSEDVTFIRKIIPRPLGAADSAIWRQMMGELSKSFQEARATSLLKAFLGSVKGILKMR